MQKLTTRTTKRYHRRYRTTTRFWVLVAVATLISLTLISLAILLQAGGFTLADAVTSRYWQEVVR